VWNRLRSSKEGGEKYRRWLRKIILAHHFKWGQAKADVAFGTSGYAAPEQYGSTPPTPGSDIYSLGATLHHLLSGNDPSETPFCFVPLRSCPAGLEWVSLFYYLLLSLSIVPLDAIALALDYEAMTTEEWLANCSACCVPEIGGALTCARIAYNVISDALLEDERAWGEIDAWCRAAGATLFFASDLAACVTETNLLVCGGFILQ